MNRTSMVFLNILLTEDIRILQQKKETLEREVALRKKKIEFWRLSDGKI